MHQQVHPDDSTQQRVSQLLITSIDPDFQCSLQPVANVQSVPRLTERGAARVIASPTLA